MIPDRITTALHSRKMEDRAGAVEALARLGSPEVTPLLVAALKDRSHYVGVLAAKALALSPDEAGVPGMVDAFAWVQEKGPERDPGCRIRNELAVTLGNLADSRASDVLFAGLRTVQMEPSGTSIIDTALNLRGYCALGLANIRPAGALLALSLLLQGAILTDEGYQQVGRTEAPAQALGAIGDLAAVVPLAMVLAAPQSNPPELVAACMDALVEMEADEALELIAPYLRRQPANVDWTFLCARAALALARTRRPEVLPLLAECLVSAPAQAQQPVAVAIANLRSDDARKTLMEAAGHPLTPVRAAAVAGLALFPDDEVRALLSKMARTDKSALVQMAARQAMG